MNLYQRKTPVGRADLLLLLENISHFHGSPIIVNEFDFVNRSVILMEI